MVDIETIQGRLGIELPESYAWVAEEFGIPETDKYRFLEPDELHWYSDHPAADEAPLPGGGVVVGENHVGNALVFLSFPVAGIPALSDEVYLIRPGHKPEEVGMDFAGLVQSCGAVLVAEERPVYEVAFRVKKSHADALDVARKALSARGFVESEHGDDEGEFIYVSLFGDDAAIVWVRDTYSTWFWLGRKLATSLDSRVTGWEVVVEPELDQFGDELEYPLTVRQVDISAGGEMRDIDPSYRGKSANAGDPHATARSVLLQMIGGTISPPTTYSFYLPAAPAISPRISGLLAAMNESDEVSLTEIAGQTAIRIALPDGTRQMSVVSDEELQLIRANTDAI